MTKNYRITPRALQDIKNIGRYTLNKWGRVQRNKYLFELNKRFVWLANNPHSGSHRTDIQEGYYCFLQASHLIFYIKREEGIDIIGIVHQSMDVRGYFS